MLPLVLEMNYLFPTRTVHVQHDLSKFPGSLLHDKVVPPLGDKVLLDEVHSIYSVG